MRPLNQTIKKNLERVDQLVDRSVQIHPSGVPLFSWLELSPIDSCNRHCLFCPKGDDEIAPNQPHVMRPVLYQKLAAELKDLDYQGTVMLAGYGEPTLNKGINELITAFSPVCNVEITTNGDALSEARIQGMLAAGIDKIIVSMYDGPEQIAHFETLFEKAGAPKDKYILRDRWYDESQDFGLKLTNRAGAVSTGNQEQVNRAHPCFYPHYMMMIDWNGDCFLCTQDWNRRMRSGNVMMQSLFDVWNGSFLRRYRKHLSAGERSSSPCSNCNADGTLHGQNHARAWSSLDPRR